MSEDDAVSVQHLDPGQVAQLWTIELPKGATLPPLHSQRTYQHQLFEVLGYLSFGDGHGPVLLALPAKTLEEAQA